MTNSTNDSSSNFQQIGNYKIERHIASGGMAAVYLAVDESLQRQVALKVMLPSLAKDGDFVQRFQREARAAARLEHPNIVRIYETGLTPAQEPFIAMQYIDGDSLQEALAQLAEQGKVYPTMQALWLVKQVAQALAAGGIEWAFPVEEHGLNEWRPWQYTIGSSGYGTAVTVSDIEDRTGMEVGVTISLDSGHAYVTLQPWARNISGQSQAYQLWLNAMLTLGNNAVSEQTQFIVPGGEVIVHSTGDGGVPGSGGTMSWPYQDGRDMSVYGNWNGYLGFFVPVGHGFSGLYDHSNGQGIVRAHAPNWPSGTKFFGPSTLSPSLWTDDNSNYVELWSGATGSFWSSATIEPEQTVTWTEHWYPINGSGGFNYANRLAALNLIDTGSGADIGVAVSTYFSGDIILWSDGQPVASWPVQMGPSQAFRANWQRPEGTSGSLGLRLQADDGSTTAQFGAVP